MWWSSSWFSVGAGTAPVFGSIKETEEIQLCKDWMVGWINILLFSSIFSTLGVSRVTHWRWRSAFWWSRWWTTHCSTTWTNSRAPSIWMAFSWASFAIQWICPLLSLTSASSDWDENLRISSPMHLVLQHWQFTRSFIFWVGDTDLSFKNFLSTDLQQELSFISRASVLSVIGFCSLLYTTNGLAANELFPTGVRNTSYSFGQVLSRIGVVLAPQLFVLVLFFIKKMKITFIQSSVWDLLPYLTLMTLAILDALFFQAQIIIEINENNINVFSLMWSRQKESRWFQISRRGRSASFTGAFRWEKATEEKRMWNFCRGANQPMFRRTPRRELLLMSYRRINFI